jgi:ABC-type lipoprotein export system ATPase subunit
MIFIPYDNKEEANEYFNTIIDFAYDGKIGVIAEELPLISNLAVLENIILPVSYHTGATFKELESKIITKLKEYDLSHIAYYRKNQLSNFENYIVKYIMAKFYKSDLIIFFSVIRHLFGKDRTNFFKLLNFENNENFVIIENKDFHNKIEENLKIKQMDFDQWATLNLKV